MYGAKMKILRIFIFCILLSSISKAVKSPPEELSAQSIQLALKFDTDKLVGNGPTQCEFAFDIFPISINQRFEVYGKDRNEMTQRLALLCMKVRCEHINELIHQSIKKLKAEPDADQVELMQAHGYTTEQIQTFLAQKKNEIANKYDCTNSPIAWQVFISDSCFTAPINCENRK